MRQRIEHIAGLFSQLELPELRSHLILTSGELTEYFTKYLSQYRKALPIILSLAKEGTQELVPILNRATPPALTAFQYLTEDSDLNQLIQVFLVKNQAELNAINRNHLIQFLRQPELASQLTQLLDSIHSNISVILSCKLVQATLQPAVNEPHYLSELHRLINEFTLSIDPKAISAFMSYVNLQLSKQLSPTITHELVFIVESLLKTLKPIKQASFVQQINPKPLSVIIDHCINQLTTPSKERQNIYIKFLMLLIARRNQFEPERQQVIKNRISYLDPNLIPRHEISLLKEVNTGLDQLEALFTSPEFMATCSPQDLTYLSVRYSLVFIVEHQNLLQPVASYLKEFHPLYDMLQQCFAVISNKLASQPNASALLETKKVALLNYLSEIHLDYLFYKLKTACESKPLVANKAMAVCYQYYQEKLPSLRQDVYLQAINYAYQSTQENSEHQLQNWLNQYIPELPAEKIGRQQHIDTAVYNSDGQKIAVVNKANQVLTIGNARQELLVTTGMMALHEPVYDLNKKVLGHLVESGQLAISQDRQKVTSCLILAKVPKKELLRSKPGLELLITDVLINNKLSYLYQLLDTLKSAARRAWLKKQFAAAIQNTSLEIPSEQLQCLQSSHTALSVFSLLSKIKNTHNALSLFFDILIHEQKRLNFLQSHFDSYLFEFFKNHDVAQCLASYLTQHQDKSWFADGLRKFALYAKQYKRENLLSDALAQLIPELTVDNPLLLSLVSNEATAHIILEDLFHDQTQLPVQRIKNHEMNQISHYYSKTHLVKAVEHLNQLKDWDGSKSYRFVLHLFHHQQSVLFSIKNNGLHASLSPWSVEEIRVLNQFIHRHLDHKNSMDERMALGHQILGELIFLGAQLGQISIFYTSKKFNPAIARFYFSQALLERLVDQHWVPNAIKEQIPDAGQRSNLLYDTNSPFYQDLKSNPIFIDWCTLLSHADKDINKKKIPALSVLILNYAGSVKPFTILLNHYLRYNQADPEFIQPITRLLGEFPERDFSSLLFDALENALHQFPLLMDRVVLHDMALYFCKNYLNPSAQAALPEIELLTYFGQNKDYDVVERGCMLLLSECQDKNLKNKLLKATKEARLEKILSKLKGRFYFNLIKFTRRLWTYGMNSSKNASKIIKLCDDHSNHPHLKNTKSTIKLPQVNEDMKNLHLNFEQRLTQFINLLAAIRRSPVKPVTMSKVISINQSLFNKNSENKSSPASAEAASKQEAVNV